MVVVLTVYAFVLMDSVGICEDVDNEGKGWLIYLTLIEVLGVGAEGDYFYKKKYTKSWTTTQSIENKGIPASVSWHEDRDHDFPESNILEPIN